jgi:nucleoside 2-deoxyribosyltransferase
MKIYFACSIRGGGDTSNYKTIVDAINATGAEVLSEIFVHDAIHLKGSPLPTVQIYARDIDMINQCDSIIAEVTNPSLGVGYELAYGEKLQKPVLCLFNSLSENKLSAMIDGNSYFTLKNYANSSEIVKYIAEFITR